MSDKSCEICGVRKVRNVRLVLNASIHMYTHKDMYGTSQVAPVCRVSMYVRQRSGDNIVGDLGDAFFAPILVAAIPPSHPWSLGRDERGWRNYEFQADRLGKEHIAHILIELVRRNGTRAIHSTSCTR